eukprot:Trichotokara_eunicae@DN5780_c0_g1_i1.p2
MLKETHNEEMNGLKKQKNENEKKLKEENLIALERFAEKCRNEILETKKTQQEKTDEIILRHKEDFALREDSLRRDYDQKKKNSENKLKAEYEKKLSEKDDHYQRKLTDLSEERDIEIKNLRTSYIEEIEKRAAKAKEILLSQQTSSQSEIDNLLEKFDVRKKDYERHSDEKVRLVENQKNLVLQKKDEDFDRVI